MDQWDKKKICATNLCLFLSFFFMFVSCQILNEFFTVSLKNLPQKNKLSRKLPSSVRLVTASVHTQEAPAHMALFKKGHEPKKVWEPSARGSTRARRRVCCDTGLRELLLTMTLDDRGKRRRNARSRPRQTRACSVSCSGTQRGFTELHGRAGNRV